MGEYELEYMNAFVSTTNVEFSLNYDNLSYRNSVNVNHCYNIIEWKKWRKGTKRKKLRKRQDVDGEEGEKEKGGLKMV